MIENIIDIQAVIEKYRQNDNDTGSAAVQISLLTEAIQALQQHFDNFKKDGHSRRGLMMKISKRRKLMKYLKTKDTKGYAELIADLGIRG